MKNKKEEIKNLFSKYLTPENIETVFNNAERKIKEIAIIVIHIHGYKRAHISNDLEKIAELLDEYINQVNIINQEFDGDFNQVLGNVCLLLFSTGIDGHDILRKAIQAALEIKGKIGSWCEKIDPFEFSVGIGLAYGKCLVGSIGKKDSRKIYTAIGKPVNLAFELASKASNNKILFDKDLLKIITEIEYNGLFTVPIFDELFELKKL